MSDFTHGTFQTFLGEHRLMASRCTDCDEVYLPPRPLCPRCHGDRLEWVEMSGKGTLATFTAVHVGLTAMIEAGYDRTHPYVTGIVQLDEGPMISAQILGVDGTSPEEIRLGSPMRVAFVDRGPETYLAFEPSEDAG